MAIVDFAHREIITSVVYFGPPGSGTTSSVLHLYDHLKVEEKSPLHHFAAHNETHESRFFDYIPAGGGSIRGFSLKVRIYSLPGDIRNPTHRDEILRDVDGIVFVADARSGRGPDNVRYLLELDAGMQERQIPMASLPMVFQINHKDALNIMDPQKVANELNPYGFPVTGSNAQSGEGVMDTHTLIMNQLLERIDNNLAGDKSSIRLNTVHHGSREQADDVIRRHITAIRQSEGSGQDKETVEEATRSRLRRRYAHLKPETEIETFWSHPILRGSEPFLIMESRIDNKVVILDLLFTEEGSKGPRRVNLRLGAQSEFTSAPRVQPLTSIPPELIEDLPKRKDRGADLPPVVYGVCGLLGGLLIGIFVAFLMYG